MKITPLATLPGNRYLGAEVTDIDLAQPLEDATFEAIRKGFLDYSILVIRGQNLSPQQQAKFSRRFGQLRQAFHEEYKHPEEPDVLILSNIKKDGKNIGLLDAGRMWHTDLSFQEIPAFITMLHARIIPHSEDGKPLGDTLFTSTAAAYEDLSPEMKKRAEGLRAVHRNSARARPDDKRTERQKEQDSSAPDVVHPVIRTHPVTGRKAIFVMEGECVSISGVPEQDALPLIADLAAFATRPEYTYRHVWQEGDLVLWDNTVTQHRATYDGAQEKAPPRLMHRTTVIGTKPI